MVRSGGEAAKGPAWAGLRLQSPGEGYPQGAAGEQGWLLPSQAGEPVCSRHRPATPVLWQPVLAARGGGSDTCLAGKEEGVFKGGVQPDNCSWVALPLFEM